MGKSDNGPDMQDCAQYLSLIEKQNGVITTVILTSDGSRYGQGWLLHVLSVVEGDLTGQSGRGVGTTGRWPHREHRTFEGALYGLLAAHDAALSRQDFLDTLEL